MLTYICFPPVGLECQLQFIFLCRPCVCGFRNLEGEGKERGEREMRKEDKGGGRRGEGEREEKCGEEAGGRKKREEERGRKGRERIKREEEGGKENRKEEGEYRGESGRG